MPHVYALPRAVLRDSGQAARGQVHHGEMRDKHKSKDHIMEPACCL